MCDEWPWPGRSIAKYEWFRGSKGTNRSNVPALSCHPWSNTIGRFSLLPYHWPAILPHGTSKCTSLALFVDFIELHDTRRLSGSSLWINVLLESHVEKKSINFQLTSIDWVDWNRTAKPFLTKSLAIRCNRDAFNITAARLTMNKVSALHGTLYLVPPHTRAINNWINNVHSSSFDYKIPHWPIIQTNRNEWHDKTAM